MKLTRIKTYLFHLILQVQGKDPSVDITQEVGEEDEEQFEEVQDFSAPIDLPSCDLGRLEEIAELFASVLPSPIRREKLATAIEQDQYIKKLLNLFHDCEDLENEEGLHHLHEIFKAMFILNKNSLFETMFAEGNIFDVLGILEHDPNAKEPVKHRQFLQDCVKFKEVVPISNKALLHKIHQTYRVQYIQDVLVPVPSVFEENMSTLSSFIFFSKVEIVSMIQVYILYSFFCFTCKFYHIKLLYPLFKRIQIQEGQSSACLSNFYEFLSFKFFLQGDEQFLSELFSMLADDEVSNEKRKDLVSFSFTTY